MLIPSIPAIFAACALVCASGATAATTGASPTAPAVDGEVIANSGDVSGSGSLALTKTGIDTLSLAQDGSDRDGWTTAEHDGDNGIITATPGANLHSNIPSGYQQQPPTA